jgi:FixJ family two-component response regulator
VEETVLAPVEQAAQKDQSASPEASEQADLLARCGSLTPREQEMLRLLVRGLSNKQAIAELGIFQSTQFKSTEATSFPKMKADSFAMLVKLATMLGPEQSGHLAGKTNDAVEWN